MRVDGHVCPLPTPELGTAPRWECACGWVWVLNPTVRRWYRDPEVDPDA